MEHHTLYRRCPALAVITVCLVAVAGCSDDDDPNAHAAPDSADPTSPEVSEQPSTVPFDPARESEIAKSMLLDPADYAPGWTSLPFKEVVLDGSLVETVPGCAPFLDTVFESSGRAAVTDYRNFMFFNPTAFDTQYVVVFPSEAGAEAMFDAIVDPRFGEECLQPYRELTEEFGGWCCDPAEPTTPVLFGEPVESLPVVGADDVQIRVDDDVFFIDEVGGRHGPEELRSVTLRVGRAIIVMDATTRTESGESPITVDQFETAIANAVTRARDALV